LIPSSRWVEGFWWIFISRSSCHIIRLTHLVIGEQPKGNLSLTKTVSAPADHKALRSPIVRVMRSWRPFSDEPTGRLALVFELMEMNMYEAIKGKRTPLPEQRVKQMMY
jgi:hypothetical protein